MVNRIQHKFLNILHVFGFTDFIVEWMFKDNFFRCRSLQFFLFCLPAAHMISLLALHVYVRVHVQSEHNHSMSPPLHYVLLYVMWYVY